MVIEKAQPQHISQVAVLQQTLVPFEISPASAQMIYDAICDNADHCLLVAREEDEILGTITGICCHGLGGNFLVMEDFVVKEGLRGRGIGKKLMEALDDYARSRNCIYAILVSSGFRKDAHRFYEKAGFIDDVRGFRKNY